MIGHNSAAFGETDDDAPPKGQRIVNRVRAERLLVSARLVSTLYRTPKNRIMEKRKGGEDGRALRRFLILYARGLGSPVWECAEIFDLNRKQIGQEEASYLDMMARNPELEEDAEHMMDMLDAAHRVDTGRFIRVSLTEIAAEAAAKKAMKAAKEAADLLERNAPKPKPKHKPPTEAEKIQATLIAKRRAKELETNIAIARAIIANAKGPKATKDQIRDAERAERELDEMEAKLAKLSKKR